MGIKDKASKINFGQITSPVTSAPAKTEVKPKTAPGFLMAHTVNQKSELLKENDSLKEKLEKLTITASRVAELQEEAKSWENAKATRLIDTSLIVRSKWANRDERHFDTKSFLELQQEIENAEGNVVPIKVRPISDGMFEIVYGHRRYEACKRLNIPVLALVDNLDDIGLFVEMERENRNRDDLSPWEKGVWFQSILSHGLFKSHRKLAEAIGLDQSTVSRAITIAGLPEKIVGVFQSPLDLQYRWTAPLLEAWCKDEKEMLNRAQQIGEMSPRPAAAKIFLILTSPVESEKKGFSKSIFVDGEKIANASFDTDERGILKFVPGKISEAQFQQLIQVVEKLKH